ncbi:DUF4345 domain-containing protein [Allorhizobium sp. BGMRC 0089]|uniref:DUF4345 domain-containing protein n=1 Tax=Allorhizobium sonneratiae TaxID=2934936 RepID=UPI002033DBD7|nr:DUF4345 domain-containing protein [Allorhizobium sonneratiae]MCM2293353.1 DUF4345 domain-containing protein [Allorhizobium sonneratiae]
MQFYFPTDPGEQLAYAGSVLLSLIGLLMIVTPGMFQAFVEGHRQGKAVWRLTGGLMAGAGVAALLLAQPMVYLALGLALLGGGGGLVVSLVFDGAKPRRCLFLIGVFVLAALPLLYAFGLVD